ncbi:MAG: DMT family transporter [Candidatus Babeliales bacterium]|jgi:drug/metabolite transporter (DMT)-like permease
MFLVVVLYALLALTFPLAKKAVCYAHPSFLIGFRMLIAGTFLLSYQYLFKRARCSINRSDWWLFFKTSLFHIFFAFTLEFWALQYVTALKTTLIYASTPFIAAILSYLLIKEHLSLHKIIGIVIGLCSLLPVIAAATTGPESAMEVARISLPEICLLGSVISATYAWFLVKELMIKNYSLSLINGVAMFIGGVLSMILAAFVGGFNHPVSAWMPFLGWVGLLILVANIVVYNLYGWLLHRYSITFLTFAGFLCPSFGMLYEWLFMGGVVTWNHLISLVLVTFGLYIFYRGELRVRGR